MKRINIFTTAVIMSLLMVQAALVASAATTAEFVQVKNKTEILATTAYTFTRNLTVGSKGTDVQKLQQFLIDTGYLKNPSATTYFGAQTRAALAAWQKAKGISPAVGYFGPTTRARVTAAMASTTTGPVSVGDAFTRNLTIGSTGADVKKLQEFLISEGYLNNPSATTYFGAQTKAALLEWQKANGIAYATGYFEATTRAKVNTALAGVVVVPVTPSVSYISRPVAAVVGSSVAIKFTSTGYRQANIYLCKTQIDCKTVIAANVSVVAGDNTYTWAVPADVTSGSYTIKVEDVANSNWVVYTDVPLTQPIVAAPTATSTTNATTTPQTQPVIGAISLQLPASTKVGELLVIKFTSKNVKNADIYLCSDTEHCEVIKSRYAIVDGLNDYTWTVPATITTTKQYFIKIKDADDVNSKDFKSDLFTITAAQAVVSTISVATPVSVKIGDSLVIEFTPKNIKTVSITLCSDNDHCNITVVPKYSVNDGILNPYYWSVPTNTVTTQYFVKVKDADNAASKDYVSGYFAIKPLSTTVVATTTTTTTGETIKITQPSATAVGKVLSLSYTAPGVSKTDIYLCASTTRCDVTIAKNASTTDPISFYAWTIPATTTPGEYYIKITKASSVTPFGMTKTSFTITPAAQTCRAVSGTVDYLTTCGSGEYATLGQCFSGALSWGALENNVNYPTFSGSRKGVACTLGSIGVPTDKVKIYCCK